MRYRLKTWTVVIWLVSLLACENRSTENLERSEPIQARLLHDLFDGLSEAIIFDGFSPPVASRIYAYCAVAAYSSVNYGEEGFRTFPEQLNGLNELPDPENAELIDQSTVLINCFVTVGKSLVYRDAILDSARVNLSKRFVRSNLGKEMTEKSEVYASELAAAILEWSKSDLYIQTRNYPIHPIGDSDFSWQPTAPTYGTAIEPHWGLIRTFVTDTATRDSCEKHVPFSIDPESEFYRQALEVKTIVESVYSEKVEIAKFWDCNPVRTDRNHRIAINRRQLTPAGHWVGIVKILCVDGNKTLKGSANAYLRCTVAMADGFISAWKEKFQSDLIRPETYIKKYIDPNWNTVLESPLFPEHPSAHSVISAAAATVLIPLFNESVTYTDTVNNRFGPKPRTFNSLSEAADEAGGSRVFGGIHYRAAIEAGGKLGNQIGAYINQNLITSE